MMTRPQKIKAITKLASDYKEVEAKLGQYTIGTPERYDLNRSLSAINNQAMSIQGNSPGIYQRFCNMIGH